LCDLLAAAIRRRHSVPPQELAMSLPILSYWYYHLPNFVLAALMYTLLGRVLLGLFLDPDSGNYIWRFFARITDPVIAAVATVTPKAAPPVVVWLFGVVWLFWLRIFLIYAFIALGTRPG
jgi:YggT family protein